MSTRAYTVSELDALRQVVEHRWLFGTYGRLPGSGSRISRGFQEADKTRAIEEIVRTHMLAGHTAADLLKSEGCE
jgi:hypothetical protein